jgi:hypothetical protein
MRPVSRAVLGNEDEHQRKRSSNPHRNRVVVTETDRIKDRSHLLPRMKNRGMLDANTRPIAVMPMFVTRCVKAIDDCRYATSGCPRLSSPFLMCSAGTPVCRAIST